jgi:hypothetical protein
MFPSAQPQVPVASQPRSWVAVGLSVLVLCFAALALWQQFRIRELSEARARNAERPSLPVSVRRLNGPRIAATPQRSNRASADRRFSSQVSDSDLDRVAFGAGPIAPAGDAPKSLLDDPDFLRAFEQYREGMLDARYAGLFSRLNLNADELVAFKRLLAEKDSMALDVVAVGQAVAAGAMPPEAIGEGVQAAQADLENSIRTALGSDRYDTYRDYEATMAQRATVDQLERRLSYSNTPLSPGQVDPLVKILAQNASQDSSGKVPAISLVVGADPSGIMPVINPGATGLVTDEAIAQARSLLSPQQVAALRQIQVEQQAILQAGRLITDGSPSSLLPPTNWELFLQ